jgi:hypothetical protein
MENESPFETEERPREVRTSNEFLFCPFDALGQREDMFATDDGFSGGKSPLAIFPNVNGIQFFDKPLLLHSQS